MSLETSPRAVLPVQEAADTLGISLNTATEGGVALPGRLTPNCAEELACGGLLVVDSCKSCSVPVLNVPLLATGKICRR